MRTESGLAEPVLEQQGILLLCERICLGLRKAGLHHIRLDKIRPNKVGLEIGPDAFLKGCSLYFSHPIAASAANRS